MKTNISARSRIEMVGQSFFIPEKIKLIQRQSLGTFTSRFGCELSVIVDTGIGSICRSNWNF